jgi:hypothetical protein
MLKISPEKMAKSLLIIFNKSLQQSKYPSNWKSAHVIAIFKKGDFLESLGSNYIVLIVDGQWNVLAKTPIGIYI